MEGGVVIGAPRIVWESVLFPKGVAERDIRPLA